MTNLNQVTRRGFLGRTLAAGAAGLATTNLLSNPATAATGQSQQGEWQIGIYTRPWSKHDYRVAFDAMAEAGFKYAGLMTTTFENSKGGLLLSVETTLDQSKQIGEEAKKRGLKITSVYGGGIPVGKSLEAGIDGLRRLIDNCTAAGIGSLLMGGISNAKLYDTYYKAIAECCDYAAEKQLPIVVKPHGGLNATGPQCRKAVELVGKKNFRIWYDAGNIYYCSDGKLDPVDDAATLDGLVTGMCVKDYKHPKRVDITPGAGMVNFPALMARLKKGGFTHGSLVIETLAPGDLAQTLKEAKKARKFVEELVG